MNFTRTLRSFIDRRRTLKLFERLVLAEERSANLLQRLADHLAPLPPTITPEDLRQTGPSYGKDAEYARIQEYIAACERDTKRAPTDEEIVRYLDGEESRL